MIKDTKIVNEIEKDFSKSGIKKKKKKILKNSVFLLSYMNEVIMQF
jgi:hypothetical protein